MVFSSTVFIFLFLPLFLMLYYLTPGRWKNLLLLVASYSFYAWWRVDFLALFIGVTLWNWVFGNLIYQRQQAGGSGKNLLTVAIIGDLLTLGYFKYADFGIDSLNGLMATMGYEPFDLAHVLLPIGISFYTFQAISYVIDVYRKDVKPTKNLIDFAAFIALFPQLIAGPVLRYKDLADQFESRSHTLEKFNEGAWLFMIGFCKKVLIADTIAPIADASFALESPTFLESWLGIFAYTSQLYFDFSGYSDMAIGLGLMLGFRFINNFNQPYISQSITEFWRRWHISLSSWLRDYLYIPLGGNRGGAFLTYRNLFLTMLLGGLWHGANWTFLVWGAWHGLILAFERYFKLGTSDTDPLKAARILTTLLLVMMGWVFFRADNVGTAFEFLYSMLGLNGLEFSVKGIADVASLSFLMLCFSWWLIFYRGLNQRLKSESVPIGINYSQLAMCGLFAVAVSKLMAESYSPFLYFQF
ncbi:MBOAT family O-acyltransferase [Endozoicomonas arenosclerae]|uniref:MBOAT family O-acyltransferase n=1 Tax=Endozoicomonas arenosclerae TaxID=1633495 RepID=UPI000780C5B0|nr:MBOAT family protein [Endozoicomonas arenosclerae]